MGGSRSHSDFCFGKSSKNSPKPVVIFWSSRAYTMCILSVHTESCWLLLFECSVHVSDGLPKKSLDGGGWVG